MTFKSPSKTLYCVVAVAWVVLVSIPLLIVAKSNVNLKKQDFFIQATTLYAHFSDQAKVNETVVEGFAASLSALEGNDQEQIREYAKLMRDRYPHIFMFETADKVINKDKDSFECHYRENIYQDFKIKSFSYETDRQWQGANAQEFYLPITFMEPFLPGSRKVLGLDVSYNSFLIENLQKTIKTHSSVSTRPFTLVEGDLAYLIYKPITKYGVNAAEHEHSFSLENRYAILVILAGTLFKDKLALSQDLNIRLYHSDFSETDSEGTLYYQHGGDFSKIESILFPKLVFNKKLNNKSQPFVLLVEQQLGWKVINWWIMLAVCIAAVIAFYVMLYYAKVYHKLELDRKQETDNLFYLANHDSLTGLANRNLMIDRLSHALKQAERSKTCLAVMFMDLNGFKHINDTYGHDIGDKLLKSVSERLLACIRRGDTLARRSGDEFVLIIENIKSKEKAKEVAEKIKTALERSFYINQAQIKVDISLGTAIYPDDAQSEDELLNLADIRMYQDKKELEKD